VTTVLRLPRVDPFLLQTEVRAASQFAALGEPLTEGDRADAQAYARSTLSS